MGGSGSTGSSLLKNILNRHPAIFAGEESNLFCKKELYTSFSKHKFGILHRGVRGLRNHGWHMYNGVDLHTPEYHLDHKILKELIRKSDNFNHLIDLFKDHFRQFHRQSIWVEKTPANASSFGHFLDSFPEGKIIHIVRHPQDTIASLMSRGYGLVYAIGIYLINTSCGLSFIDDPRCLTIKYENLTSNPKMELDRVFDFLGIHKDYTILDAKREKLSISQLEGWQFDETAAIAKGSIGRFQSSDPILQGSINYGIRQISINDKGQNLFNTSQKTVEEIADKLNYSLDFSAKSQIRNLNRLIQFERIKRLKRLYTSSYSFPLSTI